MFKNFFSRKDAPLNMSTTTSVSMTLSDGETFQGNNSVEINKGEVVKAECSVVKTSRAVDASGLPILQYLPERFIYSSENSTMDGKAAAKYVSQLLVDRLRTF